MKDALDETLLLSNKFSLIICETSFFPNTLNRIIGDLVADVLIDVGVLYKASEGVECFLFVMYRKTDKQSLRLQCLICCGHLRIHPFVSEPLNSSITCTTETSAST
jgi:hypothetical protein